MTGSEIGIVITIFLVILAIVLIWDEIRAEQRARLWYKNEEQKLEKELKETEGVKNASVLIQRDQKNCKE